MLHAYFTQLLDCESRNNHKTDYKERRFGPRIVVANGVRARVVIVCPENDCACTDASRGDGKPMFPWHFGFVDSAETASGEFSECCDRDRELEGVKNS